MGTNLLRTTKTARRLPRRSDIQRKGFFLLGPSPAGNRSAPPGGIHPSAWLLLTEHRSECRLPQEKGDRKTVEEVHERQCVTPCPRTSSASQARHLPRARGRQRVSGGSFPFRGKWPAGPIGGRQVLALLSKKDTFFYIISPVPQYKSFTKFIFILSEYAQSLVLP